VDPQSSGVVGPVDERVVDLDGALARNPFDPGGLDPGTRLAAGRASNTKRSSLRPLGCKGVTERPPASTIGIAFSDAW
jgi:hypothetical protein